MVRVMSDNRYSLCEDPESLDCLNPNQRTRAEIFYVIFTPCVWVDLAAPSFYSALFSAY
jgi:hypothetical protein